MPSLILETGSRAVFHTILVFSLFLFFSGHNAPGGGFIGGLVAGAAFVIRYIALGSGDLKRLVPLRPEQVMGLGLFVSAATGPVALFYGEVFETAFSAVHIPVLREVELSTSLLFDVGVYLVVVGLVLAVLRYLGAEDTAAGDAP